MSTWLFSLYMDAVMKEVKMGTGRRGESGDCRTSCIEVYRRRGAKINAGKSKVMVMNGEEKLDHEVHVDGICLEHVSEFKYLG